MLLGLFSLARVVLVLQANATGSYGLVSLLFVVMALTPLLILGRPGRERIGLTRRLRPLGALAGIAVGAGCCALMIVSAHLLFGLGEDNAFVYVARSYSGLPPVMGDSERLILFGVFALIAMTLSPFGEELFYRGLVHECFAGKVGEGRSACIDAAAFALVHLAHFGLVWSAVGWVLLPLPALWWVCGMFITALAFNWSRRASGSVVGAVAAHSAFNLVMTAWIFFGLL
ncbi:MAG TPA: CPBP family intramembrane glutamic endopeptidase [Allosphingosinicella sp.]